LFVGEECTLFDAQIGFSYSLLVAEQCTKKSKPKTDKENNRRTNNQIKNDVRLVGFTSLAIVLGFAIIAFHMSEHRRAERAAPPGITHLLYIGASTSWAGDILSKLVLRHTISSINNDGDKLLCHHHFITATVL
jgi:hypothetical protein